MHASLSLYIYIYIHIPISASISYLYQYLHRYLYLYLYTHTHTHMNGPAEPTSMFTECRVAWTRKRKRASCLDYFAWAVSAKDGRTVAILHWVGSHR